MDIGEAMAYEKKLMLGRPVVPPFRFLLLKSHGFLPNLNYGASELCVSGGESVG